VSSPAKTDRGVLAECADLLEKALTVVTLADLEDSQDLSYSVALPHSTTPHPAWRLVIDVDI
jgi:hypothetical protein